MRFLNVCPDSTQCITDSEIGIFVSIAVADFAMPDTARMRNSKLIQRSSVVNPTRMELIARPILRLLPMSAQWARECPPPFYLAMAKYAVALKKKCSWTAKSLAAVSLRITFFVPIATTVTRA